MTVTAKSRFVNALTFARLPLIFAWLGFAVAQELLGGFWLGAAACLAMLASGLTDLFDGRLARKWGVVSSLGKMADPLMDKMFYLVAFPALVWQAGRQAGGGVHAMVLLDPFRTDVIQSLLRAAVLGLCGAIKQRILTDVEPLDAGTANNHFQRFLDLLHSVDVKHRTVEWYATELCITPKYLSSICKKQSGKTANEWITEHVLEDIRYYLKQTDYSIKQICDLLGFPNTSFFGKYVKDHFGMTPMQLRIQ